LIDAVPTDESSIIVAGEAQQSKPSINRPINQDRLLISSRAGCVPENGTQNLVRTAADKQTQAAPDHA
jgi:hypothetical protein